MKKRILSIAAGTILLGTLAVSTVMANSGTAPSRYLITAEQAAQLAQSEIPDAKVYQVERDRENGTPVYEVDLENETSRYEVTLDAQTGAVWKTEQKLKKSDSVDPALDASSLIDVEQAKSIALSHAGLTEAEVVLTKAKLDYDDRKPEYEIEFRKDNREYEYEIDAISGAIRKWESEQNRDQQTGSENGQGGIRYLALEEAKNMVLAHAGLSDTDVLFTKAKLEFDDGRAEYEIEFRKDNREYEYEIDAVSGAIRKGEFEQKKEAQSNTGAQAQTISLEAAKEIAFTYAGVTAEQAAILEAELDREDGQTVYEIEFTGNGQKWELEINAFTGVICKAEQKTIRS